MMNRRGRKRLAYLVVVNVLVILGTAESVFAKPKTQNFKIEITAQGYKPENLKLRRGVPARVTFVRTTDATCVKEIVVPHLNFRRALPLNQPVVVSFTPRSRGSFTFVCGMNMMSGQIIVQ